MNEDGMRLIEGSEKIQEEYNGEKSSLLLGREKARKKLSF